MIMIVQAPIYKEKLKIEAKQKQKLAGINLPDLIINSRIHFYFLKLYLKFF